MKITDFIEDWRRSINLVWDIEADDLLADVTKIHCVCGLDADTGQKWSFGPDQIPEAIDLLSQAKNLIGHNILGYDILALNKIHGWSPRKDQEITDTFVQMSLLFPDQEDKDYDAHDPKIKALQGSHALEAWGIRLKCHKQDYQEGFEHFTPGMLVYCEQDVQSTFAVYKHLKAHPPLSPQAVSLEQRIHYEYALMEARGFPFNVDKATALSQRLQEDLQRLQNRINEIIPPKRIEGKTPQFWSLTGPSGEQTQHETKGAADSYRKAQKWKPAECLIERGPNRFTLEEFNPRSSKQRLDLFVQKYGWISPKLTEGGQEAFKAGEGTYDEIAKTRGSTEEAILRTLDFPEAEVLADCGMVGKVVSMLESGKSAWMKQVRDGRIHGRTKGIGTITTRSSMATPNLQQTPSVQTADGEVLWGFEGRYGADCRDLFEAPPGKLLIGTDLSGIEACMLAHFLHPFDNGVYADVVLHGDIHSLNVDAFKKYAGYTISRRDSKTIYYAWCYGAQDMKLGQEAVDSSEEASRFFRSRLASLRRQMDEQKAHATAYRAVGKAIRNAFEQGISGLDKLTDTVRKASEKGYLSVLDGHRIPVRKKYAALNTLLQGSAAIVMKRWVVKTINYCNAFIPSAELLAVIHDEMQMAVAEEDAERYSAVSVDLIAQAGKHYDLKIPLTGEAKIGKTWQETH